MGDWFDEQFAITGNHDERVARKTGGEITLEMLMRGAPIKFSPYSYMYMFMPAVQEWVYICHQYAYSKTPVRLAQQIWEVVSAPDGYDNTTGQRIEGYDEWTHGKNKEKCHVLVTHTHVAQDGFSPDGNYRCIGLGCMRDAKKTQYKSARATKFPECRSGNHHHLRTILSGSLPDLHATLG